MWGVKRSGSRAIFAPATGRKSKMPPPPLSISTIAAWFAVTSGADAHGVAERIPGVARAVQLHEDAGHDVRNVLLFIALIEVAALVPALVKWRRLLLAASAIIGLGGAYELYERRVG